MYTDSLHALSMLASASPCCIDGRAAGVQQNWALQQDTRTRVRVYMPGTRSVPRCLLARALDTFGARRDQLQDDRAVVVFEHIPDMLSTNSSIYFG